MKKIVEGEKEALIHNLTPAQKKRIDKETKAYMKTVKAFLEEKNGVVPPEWQMNLVLLETYYRLFLECSEEIKSLDSILLESRYGVVETPLLKIQNQAAVRLEKYISELGLSLKSAAKLDIAKPVAEVSPLDAFLKDKIEKR